MINIKGEVMNKIMIIWMFIFYLLLSSQIFVLSDDAGFTVTGEIVFKKGHDITVEIINKEEYDKNLTSLYSIIIEINEEIMTKKKVSFSITGVPAGEYIVKVYQDLNGNGKFDFALFRGEPIGTYKKPGFTLGRPSFKSLAFKLTEDLTEIEIKL